MYSKSVEFDMETKDKYRVSDGSHFDILLESDDFKKTF